MAEFLREVVPWTAAVIVPPGWDRRYTECFGFTLEDISEEGAKSLQANLRAAGVPLEKLPGGPPIPLEMSPREQGERGLALVRAGIIGEANGSVRPTPEHQQLLFDTLTRSINPDHGLKRPTTLAWDFRDAPSWSITIDNGSATARAERAEHADLTFRCRYEDWVDVVAGRTDPKRAMLTGRLRPRGNPLILARMPQILGVVHPGLPGGWGCRDHQSQGGHRMKLHRNHATCPNSRRLICRRVIDEDWTLQQAAEAAGCSVRTAAKWVRRFRDGDHALEDRSSRPAHSPNRMPERLVRAVGALRRLRMTAAQIGESLGIPLSTVSLWLRRIGLGKRSRLEPPDPPNRYERRRPGELVHVDIKQLGRISERGAGHRVTGHRGSQFARREGGVLKRQTGFEYVHVMIDDHSRLAYAEVLPSLTADCAIAFLRRAVAWFAERGVRIRAVMTDNGSCYVAHAHRAALRDLGLRHLRIRPYRPRTNGKAERFIQTLLDEWAWVRAYGSSPERAAALPLFLERYNFR